MLPFRSSLTVLVARVPDLNLPRFIQKQLLPLLTDYCEERALAAGLFVSKEEMKYFGSIVQALHGDHSWSRTLRFSEEMLAGYRENPRVRWLMRVMHLEESLLAVKTLDEFDRLISVYDQIASEYIVRIPGDLEFHLVQLLKGVSPESFPSLESLQGVTRVEEIMPGTEGEEAWRQLLREIGHPASQGARPEGKLMDFPSPIPRR